MAWSKYGTTTQYWDSTTYGGTSSGAQNAARDPATSDDKGVLEEAIEFLATRGWTVDLESQSDLTDNDSNVIGTSYVWRILKNFVCEDGSTQTTGYLLQYLGYTTQGDQFNMWLIDGGDNSLGRQVESGTLEAAWNGRWTFWVSDEDADSFMVLRSDASHAMIGFWPPAGSLFYQGYGSSTFPLAGGLAPLSSNSGPCFSASANSYGDQMALRFAGSSSYASGLSSIPEKYDFTWVTDDDGRPVFRTQGGDVAMMLTLSEGDRIGPYPNLNYMTEVFKFGDQYYIGVGDDQKLLFNTGTIAPVF